MSANPGLFVRPSKFRLSNLLQNLVVANHISSQLGGCLHFHFPREPEQQRPLSYGIVVPRSPRAARRLLDGSPSTYIRVPFPRSIAEASPNISTPGTGSDKRIGLREVAPLIGLRWDEASRLPGEIAEDDSGQKVPWRRLERGSKDDDTWIEVKLERSKGQRRIHDGSELL